MKIASIALLALAVSVQAQTTIKPAPKPTEQGTTPPPTNAQPAATTAAVAPDAATYSDDELGLTFTHPKTWKVSKVVIQNKEKLRLLDPKTWHPPRRDVATRFMMPLPGVKEKGTLEIYPAQFNSEPEIWQSSQRDINSQLKRTVLRQWEEEILGVPLLMTKIQSSDKTGSKITETGLMYSATPRKLVFRVSATPDNFDKADFEFRQVMQTVHTLTGHLPSTEDPNRPQTLADKNPGSIHSLIMTIPTPAPIPVEKGSVITEVTTAGKKLQLRTPTGWKVQKNADGTFTLTSPTMSGAAKITVASVIESDPPGKALIHSSGQTLDSFTKVTKREEAGPFMARSQSQVVTIFRTGVNGAKPAFSYDAVGTMGDFYWLLTWTGNDAAGKDRHALDALAQIVSVEPAP